MNPFVPGQSDDSSRPDPESEVRVYCDAYSARLLGITKGAARRLRAQEDGLLPDDEGSDGEDDAAIKLTCDRESLVTMMNTDIIGFVEQMLDNELSSPHNRQMECGGQL